MRTDKTRYRIEVEIAKEYGDDNSEIPTGIECGLVGVCVDTGEEHELGGTVLTPPHGVSEVPPGGALILYALSGSLGDFNGALNDNKRPKVVMLHDLNGERH